MRYFFDIAFKGALFSGWQKQPNGLGVQEVLEQALQLYFRHSVPVVGAGRTDAGVNALSLPVHCDLPIDADDYTREKWRRAVNGILPHEIHVRRIVPVLPGAHARFDALSRTYYYFLAFERDPFIGPYVLPLREALDFDAMNHAARHLIGEKDFTSFSRLHNDAHTNICRVSEAYWSASSYPAVWQFTITANRFLRNMVRAIVGTLLEIGRGRMAPEAICDVLLRKDRSAAGPSVIGEALFLARVSYPIDIFLSPTATL